MRYVIFHILFVAAFCYSKPLSAHQVSSKPLTVTQRGNVADLCFENIISTALASFDCVEAESEEEIEDKEPLSEPLAAVGSAKTLQFTLKNTGKSCQKNTLVHETPFLQAIPLFILICVFRI